MCPKLFCVCVVRTIIEKRILRLQDRRSLRELSWALVMSGSLVTNCEIGSWCFYFSIPSSTRCTSLACPTSSRSLSPTCPGRGSTARATTRPACPSSSGPTRPWTPSSAEPLFGFWAAKRGHCPTSFMDLRVTLDFLTSGAYTMNFYGLPF